MSLISNKFIQEVDYPYDYDSLLEPLMEYYPTLIDPTKRLPHTPIPLSHLETIPFFAELHRALQLMGITIINGYLRKFREYEYQPIHIDHEPPPLNLNIPLLAVSTGVTSYYDLSSMPELLAEAPWYKTPSDSPLKMDKMTDIERMEEYKIYSFRMSNRPTLLNTSIPHSVMTEHFERAIISLHMANFASDRRRLGWADRGTVARAFTLMNKAP